MSSHLINDTFTRGPRCSSPKRFDPIGLAYRAIAACAHTAEPVSEPEQPGNEVFAASA